MYWVELDVGVVGFLVFIRFCICREFECVLFLYVWLGCYCFFSYILFRYFFFICVKILVFLGDGRIFFGVFRGVEVGGVEVWMLEV